MIEKQKNPIEQMNETSSWFFQKINKIDKPLADSTKRKEKGSE